MHISNLFLIFGLAASAVYSENSATLFTGDKCDGNDETFSYSEGIKLNVPSSTKSFKLNIDPSKRKYWTWVASGVKCDGQITDEERDAGLGLEAWYAYGINASEKIIKDNSCFSAAVEKEGGGLKWGDSGMKCLRLQIHNDPVWMKPTPKDVKVFDGLGRKTRLK